jgi:hypothetical protein
MVRVEGIFELFAVAPFVHGAGLLPIFRFNPVFRPNPVSVVLGAPEELEGGVTAEYAGKVSAGASGFSNAITS